MFIIKLCLVCELFNDPVTMTFLFKRKKSSGIPTKHPLVPQTSNLGEFTNLRVKDKLFN